MDILLISCCFWNSTECIVPIILFFIKHSRILLLTMLCTTWQTVLQLLFLKEQGWVLIIYIIVRFRFKILVFLKNGLNKKSEDWLKNSEDYYQTQVFKIPSERNEASVNQATSSSVIISKIRSHWCVHVTQNTTHKCH